MSVGPGIVLEVFAEFCSAKVFCWPGEIHSRLKAVTRRRAQVRQISRTVPPSQSINSMRPGCRSHQRSRSRMLRRCPHPATLCPPLRSLCWLNGVPLNIRSLSPLHCVPLDIRSLLQVGFWGRRGLKGTRSLPGGTCVGNRVPARGFPT